MIHEQEQIPGWDIVHYTSDGYGSEAAGYAHYTRPDDAAIWQTMLRAWQIHLPAKMAGAPGLSADGRLTVGPFRSPLEAAAWMEKHFPLKDPR